MGPEFATIPFDHALRVLEMRLQVRRPVRRRRSHLQCVRIHARSSRAARVSLDEARLREQARKKIRVDGECRLDGFVFAVGVVALPVGCSQRQQQHHVRRCDLACGSQQVKRAANVTTLQSVKSKAEERLRVTRLEAPPESLGLLPAA